VARALKLGAQGLALAGVAGLLALLVWRVLHQNRNTAARQVAHGQTGPAPAFTLPRLSGGGKVSLASLRGKGIVINFWASWCAPCKAEAPLLERAWRQYRSRGLVVVGIDSNDVSSDARAFVSKHGLTYTLLHDPGATSIATASPVFPRRSSSTGAGGSCRFTSKGRSTSRPIATSGPRGSGWPSDREGAARRRGGPRARGSGARERKPAHAERARGRGDVPDLPHDPRPVGLAGRAAHQGVHRPADPRR